MSVDAFSAGMESFKNSVEIIVFEVGGQRYGADAALVLRVGRASDDTRIRPELGRVEPNGRALHFRVGQGIETLKVDAVKGVVRVRQDSLRRLPAAAASPISCGVWLDGASAVVLLDLPSTVN